MLSVPLQELSRRTIESHSGSQHGVRRPCRRTHAAKDRDILEMARDKIHRHITGSPFGMLPGCVVGQKALAVGYPKIQVAPSVIGSGPANRRISSRSPSYAAFHSVTGSSWCYHGLAHQQVGTLPFRVSSMTTIQEYVAGLGIAVPLPPIPLGASEPS